VEGGDDGGLEEELDDELSGGGGGGGGDDDEEEESFEGEEIGGLAIFWEAEVAISRRSNSASDNFTLPWELGMSGAQPIRNSQSLQINTNQHRKVQLRRKRRGKKLHCVHACTHELCMQ